MLRRVASANISQIAVAAVGGAVMAKLSRTNNSASVMCNARRTLVYTPRLRDFNFLYDEVFDMYNHYAQLKGKS